MSESSNGRESDVEPLAGLDLERRESRARTFSAVEVERIVQEKRNIHHITRHRQEAELDNLNFSIWDYGGQDVFYTLHHLFLTRFGVYVICFNVRDVLSSGEEKEAALEDLLFWLNSVRLHAPASPVILVGTFVDKLKSKAVEPKKNTELESVDKRLRSSISLERFEHVVMNDNLLFFPVSNKEGLGFDELKEALVLSALGQPHLQNEVPLSWMKTLDEILKVGKKSFLTHAQVVQAAIEMGATEEEVDPMLDLFNELGVVVYVPKSSVLRDKVITNPQWLVDKLGLLIRDKKVHEFSTEAAKDSGLEEELGRLAEGGIALRDVLEFLWGKGNTQFLLEIMRETLLIAEWNFGSPDTYLVPCLVGQVAGID